MATDTPSAAGGTIVTQMISEDFTLPRMPPNTEGQFVSTGGESLDQTESDAKPASTSGSHLGESRPDDEDKSDDSKPLTDKRDPDEISDADAESESSSGVDSDAVERASHLRSSKIHEAYLKRLEKQKSKRKNSERAPAMVRGIIDYMKMLEDRIQNLESTAVAKPAEDETVDQQKKADEEAKLRTLLPEIKFYHNKGEFNSDGNWNDNVLKKGSYQSKLEPNYLIRVLYDCTDGNPPQNTDKDSPESNDIDILAFGIMSPPVATFFNKRIGIVIEESEGHPVRFGKPFRPLLRNFQSLKDHLAKLEKKFQLVYSISPCRVMS